MTDSLTSYVVALDHPAGSPFEVGLWNACPFGHPGILYASSDVHVRRKTAPRCIPVRQIVRVRDQTPLLSLGFRLWVLCARICGLSKYAPFRWLRPRS